MNFYRKMNPQVLCLGLLLLAVSASSCAELFFPKTALVKIVENDLQLEGNIPVNRPPAGLASFDGLGDILGLNKGSTLSQDTVLNVLLVPGVRKKEWSNYNSLIAYVKSSLNFDFLQIDLIKTESGLEDNMLGKGELTLMKFIRKDKGSNKTYRLNFCLANWTKVTQHAKDSLYLFDKIPEWKGEALERTFLADKAKRGYMIDIFSDMALYRQKDYHEAINHNVLEGFNLLTKDGEEHHPLVCITGSMGSEIIIDVFSKLRRERNFDPISINLAKNLSKIFMLNNQLIFSSILDYSSKDYSPENPNDVISLEEKLLSKLDILMRRSQNPDLKIISFYDPNDILGFQIPLQSLNKLAPDKFIKIPITHTTQWSIDAKRLKDNYLTRLPLGKSKDQVVAMVGKSKKVNVGIGIDAPSESAKTNTDVLKYIVEGHHRNTKLAYSGLPTETENIIDNDESDLLDTLKKDGIIWNRGKKEIKRKRASIQRVVRFLYKASGMTRAVDLPYISPPSNLSLKGIQHAIQENSASGNKTTYILTVHGMANKTPNHFDHMASEIATKLGFIPNVHLNGLGSLSTAQRVKDFHFGIRKLAYRNSEQANLVFVIVHWSPLSRPVKNQLTTLNNDAIKNADIPNIRRSFVQKALKEKVIIDGFVDVNLAFGDQDFMELMGSAVNAGMQEINKLDSSLARNVFFISGSLGSKILYEHVTRSIADTTAFYLDVSGMKNMAQMSENDSTSRVTKGILRRAFLTRNAERIGMNEQTINSADDASVKKLVDHWLKRYHERKVAAAIVAKTSCWYMLTNQIAMIGLKELDSTNRSKYFRDQLWHAMEVNETFSDDLKFHVDMEVIAFHDPNDLLTFQLTQARRELEDKFRVTNIPLRTGGGFEIDLLAMYKFVRKVDKKLYAKLAQNTRKEIRRLREEEEDGVEKAKELKRMRKQIQNRRVKQLKDERNLLLEMTEKGNNLQNAAGENLVKKRIEKIEADYKIAKDQKRQKSIFLTPALLNLYDIDHASSIASQPFMLRFDKAHDKVSANQRVLNVIVFGVGQEN